MFFKSVSVLLFALCLVQPNKGEIRDIIGGFYVNWANAANNATQNQTAQSRATLLAQQALIIPISLSADLTNKINSTIINFKKNLTTTYPIASIFAETCFALNQLSVLALSGPAITNLTNVCKPNIADAMLIAENISLTSQQITARVANYNSTYISFCPPPASGDFLGNILWVFSRRFCFMNVAAGIASNVISTGFGMGDNQRILNTMVQNITSFDYAACQANFFKTYQTQVLAPLLTPLQQCFVNFAG